MQVMEQANSTRRTPARVTRGAKRSVALSLLVHAGLAALLFGTAWGVVRVRREEPPVVLTADFDRPAPAVVRDPSVQPDSSAREADSSAADAAARALSDRLRALEESSAANPELDALARRFGALYASDDEAPVARPRAGASFAGLVSGNATKVAYVVDASGSMIGSFSAIVDEVERSLSRLEPTQQFTVVCFRKDGAAPLNGDPALRPASKAERGEAVRWLRERVIPAGRSSPLEALSLALRSGADCVFLLSTTVTGANSHELDRASMLALVDRLNPRDPASGRRRATIQCIQFLEPDPGATLEALAAEHFGDGGYKFIPRSATKLDAAPETPPSDARLPKAPQP
jgi:hypothetical protein